MGAGGGGGDGDGGTGWDVGVGLTWTPRSIFSGGSFFSNLRKSVSEVVGSLVSLENKTIKFRKKKF